MLRKQINNIISNQINTEHEHSPQDHFNDSFDSQNSGRKEYDSERYQQGDGNSGLDNQNKQKKQAKKSSLLQNMEKMEQKRQERREKMSQMKQQKLEKEQLNKESNRNVDIDFEMLVEQERLNFSLQHVPISNQKLSVIVRKRPLFQKEEEEGELDSISCVNPLIRVHEPKFKVDGITKYIDNQDFQFDNSFSEKESTEDVYKYSLQPLIRCIFDYGVVTCFAYGQTGSGKTYTMRGLQQHYINDIFNIIQNNHQFSLTMSYFEIYGGKCFDLLNERNQLNILEDKNNNVQIQNLIEKPVRDQLEMIEIIEQAAIIRTTHATNANEESSRSHAICQIVVKEGNGAPRGKLIMVDLAGSERAQDCQSNSKQRRQEGANINQSLLALKECIRSMDSGAQHVPFRGSKLTLVLRDSFLSKSQNSHIVMFACISPGSSSSDHTVNTLRYADTMKESSGIKLDVVKLIEEQSRQRRKKWNQPTQIPQPQSVGQKKKEIEEVDSSKKNVIASKKNLALKFEGKAGEEKQYDHTQYLMVNAKNKENVQSAENVPSLINSVPEKNQNQDKKHSQMQAKQSHIQKIPPIQQNNHSIESSSQSHSLQQATSVSTTATPSVVTSALAQLHRERRDERPQTQQKRTNSVNKKGSHQSDQNNTHMGNLLQQKNLNTEQQGVNNVSGVEQSKAQSQKHLKQVVQPNQITNSSQQQTRVPSSHPINSSLQNNVNNNLHKEEVVHSNNSFHNQGGAKKVQNQQQLKKVNQSSQNMDNITTINHKHHARDSSANHTNKNNNINNNNQNDQSLNDHILQRNKEVQENIEKAQQHQLEQKTKDLILQQLKEKQEDMFSAHMSAIKEDANLLSLESGLLTDCQRDGFMDCDIDNYVKKFESILSKKLFMYNLLQQKMDTLKKMRTEYTGKYATQNETKQQNMSNKQEDPNKKRQSFLLKKKLDN